MHSRFHPTSGRLLASIIVLTFLTLPGLRAADPAEEAKLIQILQSESTLQQKDAACAQLKRFGTAHSIAALGSLLAHPDLTHSARHALETMPFPEASQTLRNALAQTHGDAKAGIIHSLGFRRDHEAAPLLVPLLKEADTNVARAAAIALGNLDHGEALAGLKAALPATRGLVREAVVDALLATAGRRVDAGQGAAALTLLQTLDSPQETLAVRIAAYRGMIRAGGAQAIELIRSGLLGQDGAHQVAALQMARELTDPRTTAMLVDLLPKLAPELQAALLDGLAQRGDPAAAPGALALLNGDQVTVRTAAVAALGPLGHATNVPALLAAAARGPAPVQKAARESLVRINRGPVAEMLLSQLSANIAGTQGEVILALSGRAEASALPRLLQVAGGKDTPARLAAWRALGALADAHHLPDLVQRLAQASDAETRTAAQTAIASVCQRTLNDAKPLDASPITRALEDAAVGPAAKASLLEITPLLVDPTLRHAIRRAAADTNPVVQEAGLRALCETTDPELLDDLLNLIDRSSEPRYRTLALRGYVRLATETEPGRLGKRPPAELLNTVAPRVRESEERRIVLSGLARVPDSGALATAEAWLEDTSVRKEAIHATIQISGALSASKPQEARRALEKVLSLDPEASQRQSAEEWLKKIAAMTEYITAWQISGPYRQAGKDHAALFDVTFPPERPDLPPASWQAMPAGSDAQRPWLMDVLKVLAGEQCVAYVRTRVHSEKARKALLELGTDDGVKVWLNGQLVHANNTARPLAVASDKVTVDLKEGWNTMLLKITQNNLGWEYCARLAQPDGGRLEGIRVELETTP